MQTEQIATDRVLILGATSAIAAHVAHVYAARSARLFLVGRNRDKLSAVANSVGPAVVGTSVADFQDTAGATTLIDDASRALDGIDIAVIAHGLLGDQLTTERSYTEAQQVIETNYLSVVALLIPLANRFEAQGSGHIVVLSSVAGERGRPRNYTYGSAKSALNIYLQGVRTRLWPRGVGVHTIKLGPVDTPMTATHRKHLLFGRPADVARDIVTAVDRGDAEAYVPRFWRPIMTVVRNMPEALLQRLSFLSGR